MLIIKYVYCKTIVFTVDADIFYLKQGPGTPKMFDKNLKPMVVPNIDAWLQTKTHQRYSYRGLCDMAVSFSIGLSHSYTGKDLEYFYKLVIELICDIIFKTSIARKFAAIYWVELINPGKLQKFVITIRKNFDRLKEKYTDIELYNILCRLWQFSNMHAPSEAAIFESLIRNKMLRSPQLPYYPKTTEVNHEIEILILKKIKHTEHKNISDNIIKNAKKIDSSLSIGG